MQKILIAVVALVLLVAALMLSPGFPVMKDGPGQSPTSATQQLSREARWNEDLSFLYETLQQKHPDLFYRTSKERFDSAVESLHARIPSLSDDQIKLELQRIAAMAKDGHTMLASVPEMLSFNQVYPVKLYWFNDGMYIIDADDSYKETIGSHIYQIDNTLLEEIYIRLNSYVSTENRFWPELVIPYWLRSPDVLHALGYIDASGTSTWRLVTTNDDFYTVEMTPVELSSFDLQMAELPLTDSSPDAPLYLQNTQENFWLEYLEDLNTLYVQYNAVQDSTQLGGSISQFAAQIEEIADTHPGVKVVIDVRHNTGGDNTTYAPLLDSLTSNENINQEGKLFVIIGRSTFSAAVNFVTELEQNSNTTLIGEPTGNSPNQYGDSEVFELPNSDLYLFVSSKYWEMSSPDDTRVSIMPDVEIVLSYLDFERHRDPVLEAIINNWE